MAIQHDWATAIGRRCLLTKARGKPSLPNAGHARPKARITDRRQRYWRRDLADSEAHHLPSTDSRRYTGASDLLHFVWALCLKIFSSRAGRVLIQQSCEFF